MLGIVVTGKSILNVVDSTDRMVDDVHRVADEAAVSVCEAQLLSQLVQGLGQRVYLRTISERVQQKEAHCVGRHHRRRPAAVYTPTDSLTIHQVQR